MPSTASSALAARMALSSSSRSSSRSENWHPLHMMCQGYWIDIRRVCAGGVRASLFCTGP